MSAPKKTFLTRFFLLFGGKLEWLDKKAHQSGKLPGKIKHAICDAWDFHLGCWEEGIWDDDEADSSPDCQD